LAVGKGYRAIKFAAAVAEKDIVAEMPALREAVGELVAFCRTRLSAVKCPRSIDFRTEFPRSPTGKLLKRKIRDEYRMALNAR
jgi:acyl-CoA synthetase (AMP-forming)/AMP-acid ligase II